MNVNTLFIYFRDFTSVVLYIIFVCITFDFDSVFLFSSTCHLVNHYSAGNLQCFVVYDGWTKIPNTVDPGTAIVSGKAS